jgi:hypothetical protein
MLTFLTPRAVFCFFGAAVLDCLLGGRRSAVVAFCERFCFLTNAVADTPGGASGRHALLTLKTPHGDESARMRSSAIEAAEERASPVCEGLATASAEATLGAEVLSSAAEDGGCTLRSDAPVRTLAAVFAVLVACWTTATAATALVAVSTSCLLRILLCSLKDGLGLAIGGEMCAALRDGVKPLLASETGSVGEVWPPDGAEIEEARAGVHVASDCTEAELSAGEIEPLLSAGERAAELDALPIEELIGALEDSAAASTELLGSPPFPNR